MANSPPLQYISLQNLSVLYFNINMIKVTQRLPIYMYTSNFLLVFIYQCMASLCSFIRYLVSYMHNLEFDLSKLLKVKSNGAMGLPIYNFLCFIVKHGQTRLLCEI